MITSEPRPRAAWLDLDSLDSTLPLGDPCNPAVFITQHHIEIRPRLADVATCPDASTRVVGLGDYIDLIPHNIGILARQNEIDSVLGRISSFAGRMTVDLTIDSSAASPINDLRPKDPYNDPGHNWNPPPGGSPPFPVGATLPDWRTLLEYGRVGDLVFAAHRINYLTWGTTQHVGMVAQVDGTILESNAAGLDTDKPGVHEKDWGSFARDAHYVWLARVQPASDAQCISAVAWGRARLGRPYRFPIVQGTNKYNDNRMYCSQLVWLAYLRGADIDLDRDGGDLVFPDDIFYDANVKVIAAASSG